MKASIAAFALAVVSLVSLAAGQQNQNASNSSPAYTVGILPFTDVSNSTDIGQLPQALPKLLQSALVDHSSLLPRQLDPSKSDSDSDSDKDDKGSSGGGTDAASAAALGKTNKVDLVLMGQILSSNVETKDGSFNGPSIRGLSLGSKSRSQKSTIVLQIDVIDVGRGQKIGSFRATGSDNENKVDPSASSGYGNMDMSSTGFKNSSLGKATEQALNDLTNQIVAAAKKFTPAPPSADDASTADKSSDKSAKDKSDDDDKSAKDKSSDDSAASSDSDDAKQPATPATLDGLVADVSGKTLILNVGKANGVQVGDKLKIGRTSRTVKDPATGKVLRRIDTPLGQVTITQVDDASSEGTYSGTPGVKVGDHVTR
jgi:hypothetical protein